MQRITDRVTRTLRAIDAIRAMHRADRALLDYAHYIAGMYHLITSTTEWSPYRYLESTPLFHAIEDEYIRVQNILFNRSIGS